MDMQYYFDGSLPQQTVSDLIVLLEEMFRKCPSDAALTVSMLAVGGKMYADISLRSAALHFKEKLECKTLEALKNSMQRLFKNRVSGWRRQEEVTP